MEEIRRAGAETRIEGTRIGGRVVELIGNGEKGKRVTGGGKWRIMRIQQKKVIYSSILLVHIDIILTCFSQYLGITKKQKENSIRDL